MTRPSRGSTTSASSAPPPSAANNTAAPARFSIRKLADSEARNSSGRTPWSSSQSTIGGPLTLIDVVSAPLTKPAAQPAAGGSVPAESAESRVARRLSCQPAARITAMPTVTWSASFESSVSATAPAARRGTAAASMGARARQSTCFGRPPSKNTSRLSARPSTRSELIASTGSTAANRAGLSTSAKPKPVADWIEAPTSAAAAASGIRRRCAPPDDSFDRHELLREAREHLGLPVPHDHQVLDPHAVLAGHVDARLDRDHVADLELTLGGLREARPLVYLEAHAVPQSVAEMLAVPGRLNDVAGHRVDALARRARTDRSERLGLRT